MNEQWFCGYFYHGYLNDVYASFKRHYDRFKKINGADIGIWYPQLTEIKIANGKLVQTKTPIFDNYILFSFNVETPVWVDILKFTQIFKFLKDKDGQPIPLTEKEVFHLLALESQVVKPNFSHLINKRIIVTKGHFKGFSGICKTIIKGKYRAKVLIELADFVEKEVEINCEHIELI